jgi:hypothetical protein
VSGRLLNNLPARRSSSSFTLWSSLQHASPPSLASYSSVHSMTSGLQAPLLFPHHDTSTLSSYLGASTRREQPLCGNIEGWGPLSRLRWDFTPCFLDVWIAAVAIFGILAGAGAIVYLRNQPAEPVKKNWHFWAKLVPSPINVRVTCKLIDCTTVRNRRARRRSRCASCTPGLVLQRNMGWRFPLLVHNNDVTIPWRRLLHPIY